MRHRGATTLERALVTLLPPGAQRLIDPSLRPGVTRRARCYMCSREFVVPGMATILTCPACYQHLNVADVTLNRSERIPLIRTAGSVVIPRGVRVAADLVECGLLLDVQGELRASARCAGELRLGPGALLIGSVRAASVTIAPGAHLSGARLEIGPRAA